MSKSNIVFSTDPDFNNQTTNTIEQKNSSRQDLRVHLDRRKGGKIVTLIRGFNGSNKDLIELCSAMKRKFSIGGSAKEGTILLQGNIREKAIEFLKLSGHNAKPSGG